MMKHPYLPSVFPKVAAMCAVVGAALTSFSSQATAKDVRIAVPVLSGHFNEQGDGRSKAALDAIFKECGDKATFISYRWGQHWQMFEDNSDIDAVAIVWDDAGVSGFPSDDFIHQKNGVAFRADKNFEIKTPEDLAGLRVLGFGGATRMFPSLAVALPTVKSYWEAPPGFGTTLALVNDDVDVFITDGLIFAIDYMERAEKTGDTYGSKLWPRMSFVGLFPENGDKMHFRRKGDRDAFNACLKTAQDKGAIASATAPYVEPYRAIVGDQVPKQ